MDSSGMRVRVYPADRGGCGYYRLIWPAQALARQGYDVQVVTPEHRDFKLKVDEQDVVADVLGEPEKDADVVVLQRITHPLMAQAVGVLRSKGIAVVIDMDDDLAAIHPRNPAFRAMHPSGGGQSWAHLAKACGDATMVTCSTPPLRDRYGYGHGRVIPNYLPESFYRVPHTDSDLIGWPASLHSHPDDPAVMGGAVSRLVSGGADFRVAGDPTGCGAAFALPGGRDPVGLGVVPLEDWPVAVTLLGVGVSPLADTRFNRAKSWLKPLEMSAVGVPWVASPRPEYERLHARGAGRLADTPRRWHKELARLHGSETARLELSESGRAAVDDLRIERQAWRWWEAWTEALAIQRGGSIGGRPTSSRDVSTAINGKIARSASSGTSSSTSTPDGVTV